MKIKLDEKILSLLPKELSDLIVETVYGDGIGYGIRFKDCGKLLKIKNNEK